MQRQSIPRYSRRRRSPARLHSQLGFTASWASQIVWTGPPEEFIFFSFPSAKKAIKRPSGDQKGKRPLSVPARTCDSRESSARTARSASPPRTTRKTSRLPSGEIAGVTGCPPGGSDVPRGGTTTNRVAFLFITSPPRYTVAATTAATMASEIAAAQTSFSRAVGLGEPLEAGEATGSTARGSDKEASDSGATAEIGAGSFNSLTSARNR